MDDKKLSLTQAAALGKIRAGGGRIERWPGGFWTIAGTDSVEKRHAGESYLVPIWYCSANTIEALAKRGLIVPSKTQKRGGGTEFVVEYRLCE